MTISRRRFLSTSALGAGAIAAGCAPAPEPAPTAAAPEKPAFLNGLTPMTGGVVPITDDERRARIAKAQKLMEEQRLDAIFMEGTASCFYFANMRWGLSERTFGVVIPATGELAYVCPGFEEDRARELIKFGNDVRVWQEDESPYTVIAGIVKDRGVRHGRIGIEERVRFFIADGIRKASSMEVADATPVTAGCRMYKTPAEIALMQRANDVTIAAYKAAFTTIRPGITQGELSGNIAAAFGALGYAGGASAQFGIYTAFPHGSATPQTLKEGDVVMIDGGTSVEGYASDITRTVVMGKATPRQIEIWNLEKRAQDAGFAAAVIGAPCENVDIAARKVIVDAGFGPAYKVPGLPHRTGHGIGLEGHEWTNFVLGNKTPLAAGMCFSDEPTIAIYGEFGIRLEDCLYMTERGPKFFTKQSVSIDQPFG
ncbi:MAG: Xaa-Pro peptidase family protein [Vicinamibacterales bacterium]